MALNSGIVTGLMAYRLSKEFFGESALFYRETETIDYELYGITDYSSGSFTRIQNDLLKPFAAANSGNVTVKVLNFPAEYTFPNDHLRAAKFNFQVEIRRTPSNLSGFQPEITGNYYKGLDQSFFSNYGNSFDSFSENFDFSNEENGNKSFNHSFSFVLRSGGKPKAAEIAQSLFSNDKDTTFGISTFSNGMVQADTGAYQNYFNESYDLLKNSFSFSKKREFLPFGETPYYYNLVHSLSVREDGIIEVEEKGDINGRFTFSQADQGYSILNAGAYSRCSSFYNTYKNIGAGTSVSTSLLNLPLISSRTLEKPNLRVAYSIKYNDDPSIDVANQVSLEKILDVDYSDGKFVNINQTYNFTSLVSPIYENLDADIDGILVVSISESEAEVQSYYENGPFYNPNWPSQNIIKFAGYLPNRRKSFGFTNNYTNNPIYNFTLDGYNYRIFDYRLSDTKPPDVVTEYKIINRTSKMSLINYAYQTERGTKSVSITAKLNRPSSNVFSSPVSDISGRLLSIYRWGIGKLMSAFFGLNTLALTYHLSDIQYSFDSENNISMNISVTYTIKKYTA